MKKLLSLFFFLATIGLWAQPDEEIVYYTDSDVRDSRFNLALNLNPYYTDMRLINDDAESSQFNTFSEAIEADGSFRLDYGLDLFYEIGPSFHVGVGIGRSYGGYTWRDVNRDTSMPNLRFDNEVSVSMWSVPIKVNFNTKISDVFSLEVVPIVELNFLDSYNSIWTYKGANAPADTSFKLNDRLRELNWSVGIGLGGTYWFTNEFGLFFRGSVKYMLNDMIQRSDSFPWPRETMINFGVNTGLRLRF